MDAGKQLLVTALWAAAQLAQAQVATGNGGYGPIVWPEERQHELAGHYAGTLRNYECEHMTARLTLEETHRYVLALRCTKQDSPARTLHGEWWVDEIAGSCLILNREDGERMFGFRIGDDANLLSLDGGDCNAADERDASHGLVRTNHRQ